MASEIAQFDQRRKDIAGEDTEQKRVDTLALDRVIDGIKAAMRWKNGTG